MALGAACLPSASRAGEPDVVSRWSVEIAEASERFGVPVVWIERVMRVESRGRTTLDGRPITSRAGAMGLMQLMPGTWTELRARLGLGSDPYVPRDNILAGTAYLREMYDRFGYPGLFGAYNAGPGRYAVSLASGRPLPAETQAYLASVTGTGGAMGAPSPGGGASAAGNLTASPRQTIFVVRSAPGDLAEAAAPPPAGSEPTVEGFAGPQTGTMAAPVLDPLFAVRNR